MGALCRRLNCRILRALNAARTAPKTFAKSATSMSSTAERFVEPATS